MRTSCYFHACRFQERDSLKRFAINTHKAGVGCWYQCWRSSNLIQFCHVLMTSYFVKSYLDRSIQIGHRRNNRLCLGKYHSRSAIYARKASICDRRHSCSLRFLQHARTCLGCVSVHDKSKITQTRRFFRLKSLHWTNGHAQPMTLPGHV